MGIVNKLDEMWDACLGAKIRTLFDEGEEILLRKGASRSMLYGYSCVGQLVITNKRIIFESNAKKTRVVRDNINLQEVKEYCLADRIRKATELVIKGINKDNSIFIKTECEEYCYSFNPRKLQDCEEVLATLDYICINAERSEKSKRIDTVFSNTFGYKIGDVFFKKQNNQEGDTIAKIRAYKELLDEGAITQEEYEKKKRELL